MRIAIVTLGTLGDVAPYIALGRGFIAAGDEVKIITFQQFEPFISQHGLEFQAVSHELEMFMQRDWSQFEVTPGSVMNTLRRRARTLKTLQHLLEDLMGVCLEAFTDVDLVLGQAVGHLAAWPIAQHLNIPYYGAYCSPLSRTRAFPNAFVTSILPAWPGWQAPVKGLYNDSTHALAALIVQSRIQPMIAKAFQAVLHSPLPELDPNVPILYGHSPTILPKPQEWRPNITVTGFWLLQHTADWVPPADLLAFLEAGPAPVYIGFGSMSGGGAKSVIDLSIQALKNLHLRGVILADGALWPELRACDDIFFIKSVPHTWLFPRMTAIMHHGGPGTTAAALRAGVPQIIVPFLSDQSFWGQLMKSLGVGAEPLNHKHLRLKKVQNVLAQAATDPNMRQKALALKEPTCAEDGVKQAIETIQARVGKNKPGQVSFSAK